MENQTETVSNEALETVENETAGEVSVEDVLSDAQTIVTEEGEVVLMASPDDGEYEAQMLEYVSHISDLQEITCFGVSLLLGLAVFLMFSRGFK